MAAIVRLGRHVGVTSRVAYRASSEERDASTHENDAPCAGASFTASSTSYRPLLNPIMTRV